MTSNISITEQNKKQHFKIQLRIPETPGTFTERIAPDIVGFTDKPVVQHQCDIQVVENNLIDDSKKHDKMTIKYNWFQINVDQKLI